MPLKKSPTKAATIKGVSVSEFIVTHAVEAAHEVIESHERWVLNQAQSRAFVDHLMNPPEPNSALKAAAERKAKGK